MVIDVDDFIRQVDKAFWKHISKKAVFRDVISYEDIDRENYLRALGNRINSFEHAFGKSYFLYHPKKLGILRRVKVFGLADTCIYYYCVKSIQDELSTQIKANPNVFGGFRFTPDLKIKNGDLDGIAVDPKYESGFAPKRYREEYKGYLGVAAKIAECKFQQTVHIDVAHFYDDVNLDILEDEVRSAVQGKKPIVDLLFCFLRNSDRADLGYAQTSVGVPQEEIGDMSRLLANFYLSKFDPAIIGALDKKFGQYKYIYTRWSDDMWFSFNGSLDDCYSVIQAVSLGLGRLKLHPNEGKILMLNNSEFATHWHLDAMEDIKTTAKNLTKAIDQCNHLLEDPNGRSHTIVSYLLRSILSKNNISSLITSIIDPARLVRNMVLEPKIIVGLNPTQVECMGALIDAFPEVGAILREYIAGASNHYGAVEYTVLKIIGSVRNSTEDALKFFVERFFKCIQEHQWYSRCICIALFVEWIDMLEKEGASLHKILKHINELSEYQTEWERRYCMAFLSKLRDGVGQGILLRRYSRPDDLTFLDYVKRLQKTKLGITT